MAVVERGRCQPVSCRSAAASYMRCKAKVPATPYEHTTSHPTRACAKAMQPTTLFHTHLLTFQSSQQAPLPLLMLIISARRGCEPL